MFEPQQLFVLAILIISVPSAYLLVRYRKKVGRAATHPLLKPFAIPVVVLWQLLMGFVRWFIPTRTQIVAMFVSTAFAVGFLIIKRVVSPVGPDPTVYQSGDLFAVLILLVVGFAYALATTPTEQNVTEHVEHLRGGFLHGYEAVLNYTEPKPVVPPKRRAFSWLLPRKKPVAPLVPVEPPRRIKWGGISLPWSAGNGHFVVAGVAGSGKTTLIRLFLQSTFPWIGKMPDQRAVIYDAKGEYYPLLKGMGLSVPIVLVNPSDRRGARWDIAADVVGAGDAYQLAERLMPGDDKMQPFWNEASQHLTAAVIQSFQEHSPGVWTLRDVLLALRWPERIKAIVERTPELAYVYFRYSADERLLSNLFATLSAKLRPFEQVAAAWHRSETSFRLDDWKDQVLVLGDHRPHSAAITPINQLILSLLTDRLLSEPDSDKRRSWVVLDEARELGRFTKLHSLLNQGRSKGCCVAIGFQDIDGMIDVYGRDVTNEMIGQCSNKSFLRAGGPSSAKWVEDHFGQVHQRVHQTVVSQSYSTGQHGSSTRSYNHSQTERFQAVVLASEVAGLPKPAVDGHLCGYHDIAGIACYRSQQPFNDVLAALKPPADVASFEPRRRDDQILPDWNDEDRVRLRLKSDPTPTIRPVTPPSLFNLAIHEH